MKLETDSPKVTMEAHAWAVLEAVAREATTLFGSEVTLAKYETRSATIRHVFSVGEHEVYCTSEKQNKNSTLYYVKPSFKEYPQFKFNGYFRQITGRTFKRSDKHDPADLLSGYSVSKLAQYVVSILKCEVRADESKAKAKALAQQVADSKARYEARLVELTQGKDLSDVVTATAAGYCFRIDTTDETLLARLLELVSDL